MKPIRLKKSKNSLLDHLTEEDDPGRMKKMSRKDAAGTAQRKRDRPAQPRQPVRRLRLFELEEGTWLSIEGQAVPPEYAAVIAAYGQPIVEVTTYHKTKKGEKTHVSSHYLSLPAGPNLLVRDLKDWRLEWKRKLIGSKSLQTSKNEDGEPR